MLLTNEDVFSAILSWLDCRTLLVCCRVSTDWNSIATPIAYSTVEMAQVRILHDVFLAELSTRLHLTRLVRKFVGSLEISPATGDVFAPFAALRKMTGLLELDIPVPRVIDAEAADALAALISLRSLRLRVAQNHPGSTYALAALLRSVPSSAALRDLSIRSQGESASPGFRINLQQVRVSGFHLVDALVDVLQASSNSLVSLVLSLKRDEWERLHSEHNKGLLACQRVCNFRGRQFSTGMARSFPNIEELTIDISEVTFQVLWRSNLLPKLRVLILEAPEKVLAESLASVGLIKRAVPHLAISVPCSFNQPAPAPGPPALDPAALSTRIYSYLPLFDLATLRSLYIGPVPFQAVRALVPMLEPGFNLRFLGLHVIAPHARAPGEDNDLCAWVRVVLDSILNERLPPSLRFVSVYRKGATNWQRCLDEAGLFGRVLRAPHHNHHQHLQAVQFHTPRNVSTWQRASGVGGPFQISPVDIIPREPGFLNITRWIDAQLS